MLTLVTSAAGVKQTRQPGAEAPAGRLELVGPQPDLPTDTVAVRSGRLQHVLRHAVFAELGCTHCARSYQRAMVRYSA